MTTTELGSSSLGDLAQAKIEPQISTTTDDPAGSPTWTDWQPFMIGDFVARGIRRRLLFSTDEPHHQVACSALEDKISMATRTWASASVALLLAGTRVNFSPAYYAAPEAWGNVVGGAAGDYVEVTSIDRQGATFTVKDNTGTAKNGTADLYAFGPGAEV
jgi:hypothetical protein